ncbi:hypothetical protein RFI_14787 [Reticulomyxa filosa]|uniref:Uncharacterized protein n=1 Tax=Reticulomyxa filosa TaxID=46433 RepID=X6N8R5_RETFI|nr:hypothetical protein RFI_14787 [Reticulomyxa filosa]|eukprot:ETO22411.1 hypothetical protein RFI_14787 [Reticulomyxa filosa]
MLQLNDAKLHELLKLIADDAIPKKVSQVSTIGFEFAFCGYFFCNFLNVTTANVCEIKLSFTKRVKIKKFLKFYTFCSKMFLLQKSAIFLQIANPLKKIKNFQNIVIQQKKKCAFLVFDLYLYLKELK